MTEIEAKRLTALANYRVLDSAAEKPFDDIARLAARVTDAPIAAIGLTDSERHWFKAKVGLEAAELPRAQAFCAEVVANRSMLCVGDLSRDPRFAHHPFVTGGLQIRFYVGIPLFSADGFVLGSLCVMDTVAREMDEQQLQALQVLARQATMQLELRRLHLLLGEGFPEAQSILSTISHELRTPLHGVFGGIEMLLETKLTPEQWEYLRIAQRSAEKLLRVVTQLLNLGEEMRLPQMTKLSAG